MVLIPAMVTAISSFGGKAIVVTSERGYNFTWINVEGGHRGFIFWNGETAESKLDGFTITGITPTTTCPGDPCIDPNQHYSAVLCVSSSPTITNCQFADNSSAQAAGMALFSSSAVVDSCLFIRNSSTDAGAMFIYLANGCLIRDCLFLENSANGADTSGAGGAIWVWRSPNGVTIENCRFKGNSATGASGAIRIGGAKVDVTGSTFEGNSAAVGGIACIIPVTAPFYAAAEGTWSNCTIYDNNAPTGRGVFHVHEGIREIYFENCVMAGGSGGAVQVDDMGEGVSLSCCNLYGNSDGDWTTAIYDQLGVNGNISEPPLFMFPDTSDFRLQYCSPCNPFNNECEVTIGAYEIADEETTPPTISCHTDTLEYYLAPDSSGECHVPLAIYDEEIDCQPIILTPDDATWGEYGGIYWTADTGGLYSFNVIAQKPPFGADTCDVYVYVKGPQIVCPEYDFPVHPGDGGLVMIPLTINNVFQEHVTVSPESANWLLIDFVGVLQFTADTAGTYVYEVIAETRFGADTCEVTAIVGGPVIDRPEDTICAQPDFMGQVCVELEIESNSLDEVVAGDATWSNDELCFASPDTGGVFGFEVTATDAYGSDQCSVIVAIQPLITCPVMEQRVSACPGEDICVPFNVDFASPSQVWPIYSGASWANDTICLVPDDTGSMTFWLWAGSATCFDSCTVQLYIDCPDTINLTPEGTIQAALDAAGEGDIIVLQDGVYTGDGNRDLDFGGKNLTLRSANGPANCIIDCGSDTTDWSEFYRGIWFRNGEDHRSVVDGITITRGYAYGIRCGGLSAAYASSPTIRNCILDHNGIGISVWHESEPYIVNCVFTGNCPADDRGAGTSVYRASPVFDSCLFIHNSGWGGGAAIEGSPTEPIFRNCSFIRNGYSYWDDYPLGGAIFLSYGAHPSFEDCSFYGNRGVGSALYIYGSTVCYADFTRCIIAYGDDATDHYYEGGPVNCSDAAGSVINLSCCDVYGNTAGDYIDCISGQNGVDGNISAEPMFCDTAGGDLHLLEGSPCLPGGNTCSEIIGAFGTGCVNTHTGEQVVIENGNVTITFDNVVAAGNTDVTVEETGPDIPGELNPVPLDPAQFYDITTSAVFTGEAEVCLSYEDEDVVGDEDELTLYHYENNGWVDITSLRDTVNNILCGLTSSLSPFVITEPDYTGVADSDKGQLPVQFSLAQNYPNPFNPNTEILFALPQACQVRLTLYNIMGQKVITLTDGRLEAGYHRVEWDGRNSDGHQVASGIYFYKLDAGDFSDTKKMLLLK